MATRRDVMKWGAVIGAGPLLGRVPDAAALPLGGEPETPSWTAREFDVPRLDLVLELVVTCSKPEAVGPDARSKDGDRRSVWPIVGGAFVGKDIRGSVVPGGGDFPVTRPDGVTVVDALYRLRTDDGATIIIHNKGISIPGEQAGAPRRYRLTPEFTAPRGKYDWLNKNVFVANLTTNIPAEKRLAKGDEQNDRLIHVYRLA
jgi:hypothetical protein